MAELIPKMIHETVRRCFECAYRFKGLITYRWSKHCTPKDYLPSVSICVHQIWCVMMMSSNGNIFRVTGPLWRKSTGHRWIPFTKASDAELWCFLWPAPEQTAEKIIETPVIWDAIAFVMTKSERFSLSHKRGKYSKRINECPPPPPPPPPNYSISQEICTRFLLCCALLRGIHWLIFPYPSGLLHWHCGNLTIAPVPAKQPWWI